MVGDSVRTVIPSPTRVEQAGSVRHDSPARTSTTQTQHDESGSSRGS